MHAIVGTRVHLPEVHVGAPEQRLHVVDRPRRLADDVVAHHPWAVIEVERRRTGATEVPPLTGRPAQWVCRVEERPHVERLAGCLVVGEEAWPRTAAIAIQAEDDQHRLAVDVIVDVVPVRIAHVIDAVMTAAVSGVRQARGNGGIRCRKREPAARGKRLLHRAFGERLSVFGAGR
jgi:hypothetical protein